MRVLLLALTLLATPGAARASGGDGIAVDAQGRVYFVDVHRHVLWRVDPDGRRTALAQGLATAALAVTPDGTAYLPADDFSTSFRWRVTIVTPDGATRDSVVTTDIAVNGGHTVGMDALGIWFQRETELSRAAPDGTIRSVLYNMKGHPVTAGAPLPDGRVAVLIGNMLRRSVADTLGADIIGDSLPGMADLGRTSARFNRPVAVAVSSVDNIYVADAGNRRLRHVDRNGTVTTWLHLWWPWRPTGVAARGDTAWVVERALPAWAPGWAAGVLGSPRVVRLVRAGALTTVATTTSWTARVAAGALLGMGLVVLERKRRENREGRRAIAE